MGKQESIVVITGSAGNIGKALRERLQDDFRVVGCDRPGSPCDVEMDLSSRESVKAACTAIRKRYGGHIAAVIHLAAYFDFTGEESPLYDTVNVEGTRHLLDALQDFDVERFIYASTMLVHEAGEPGEKITEDTPLAPGWAYPRSKADAEAAIRERHGHIPYTILRLAGLYDDHAAVPTLAQQIARIYERDFKSHLYSGDLEAGQAFIHQDDMLELFARVIDRRKRLPAEDVMLAGEERVMGYRDLQNRIGELLFGEREWRTVTLPEFVARTGAWVEEKSEPLVPDAIDQGEKPFIRPFMIDLASDHYALDISRAKRQLDWKPEHRIHDGLAALTANLKRDPAGWYGANGITPPAWFDSAEEKDVNPQRILSAYEKRAQDGHARNLWVHFLNMMLACWLLAAPATLNYESQAMVVSDMVCGALLFAGALLSLSWRMRMARWGCAAIGLWLLSAPLLFWAPTPAEYMNGTLVGMLVMGFSVLLGPVPGVSPAAAMTGPTVPPGWGYSPSGWFQRLPIIILAVFGFLISRYMGAYQLEHIDAVWDPFFSGSAGDARNGTEEIITSSISEAWPVPDAGLGALVYALEIVTGCIGSSRRWRTMPWLVVLFGVLIVPLGIVSITFIIIQPILLGTWCALCLIAAAAMLVQIPYSVDELIATCQFLRRRRQKGHALLRVFFTGDTDEGGQEDREDDFAQRPAIILREMLGGGVTLPWNLVLCGGIGVWLMFTRITLDASGGMADADHLIGALVLTVAVTALAEPARAVRYLILPFGAALLVTPFLYDASPLPSLVCGAALIGLSLPKGRIRNRYGTWDRCIL